MQIVNGLKLCVATLGAIGLASLVVISGSSHAESAPWTLRALYRLGPPPTLRAAGSALLLVDFQREFVSGGLPLPSSRAAIQSAADLAAWARRSGILVVLVHNVIDRPGSPLFRRGAPATDFVAELAPRPRDLVIEKPTGGAFSRTALDAELRARGIDTLIVGGFMTHLAVLTTASDAGILGYHVIVAADATATRALPGTPVPGAEGAGVAAAELQRASLAIMADRVADVMAGAAIRKIAVKP
jgi:nicotinamidase-related amidase